MCRVLIYKGKQVLIDNLLYKPNSSLIKQTHQAKMLDMLNLAGFGIMAWDNTSHEPETPFVYKGTSAPFFDKNLKQLSTKLKTSALTAHLRGTPLNEKTSIGHQNLHPFLYEGYKISMAHNGALVDFEKMRFDLIPYITADIQKRITGNTDSEWIYAVYMSQFENADEYQTIEDMITALEGTLTILRNVRKKNNIDTTSSINLFLNDGRKILTSRYCFDFGRYDKKQKEIEEYALSYISLWYTVGKEYVQDQGEWKMVGGSANSDSIIISSEPLTLDTSTWLEVPEYSALYVDEKNGNQVVGIHGIEA